MKDRQEPGDLQELGDVPIAEFRKQLHELADWIADYREKIGERPISRNVQPGEILSQLDRDAPEIGTPFEKISLTLTA